MPKFNSSGKVYRSHTPHYRAAYNRDYFRRPEVQAKILAEKATRSEGEKERKATLRRKKNLDLRMGALIAYGGNPPRCSCKCGCKEDRFPLLELSHVNNDGASHRRATCGRNYNAGSQFYQELKNKGYPRDVPMCVLCIVCNIGSYRNGGQCVNLGILPLGKKRTPEPLREAGAKSGRPHRPPQRTLFDELEAE